MSIWTFGLVIDGLDAANVDQLDALYEAGCDDASFGETDGVVTAMFDREAATPEAAVLSAIRSVETATAGVQVVRVQPENELLTATEIAERTNRSRESVRLLIEGERGPGNFPGPAAREDSRNPLWDSRDVDEWFRTYDPESVPADDNGPSAKFVDIVNTYLALREQQAEAPDSPLWHEIGQVISVAM